MKKFLISILLAVSVSPLIAQSAFQGFYGQLATGYESNSATGISSPLTATDGVNNQVVSSLNASNQNFGGMPLIAGVGYNFSIAPKWLIGIGADYSFLTQESSNFTFSLSGLQNTTLNGAKIKASNRFNIFITPGYVIDKDKLVYLKAGYSSIKAETSAPSSVSVDGDTIPFSSVGLNLAGQSKTLNGYVLGVGYKQIISGGFYGFAEANYMSYSNQNFGRSISIPWGQGISFVTSTNSGLSSYQLLVGAGYRF